LKNIDLRKNAAKKNSLIIRERAEYYACMNLAGSLYESMLTSEINRPAGSRKQ
jgi:hypothetical protein